MQFLYISVCYEIYMLDSLAKQEYKKKYLNQNIKELAMIEKELLTPTEMAQKLKVKLSFIYRQTMIPEKNGGIPRIKLAGKKYLRFEPEKVFQWIENQNAAQAA